MDRVLHVLHVDADPDIRQIVALSLALDPAMTVAGAGTASEAVALAADRAAPRPGLVLLDTMIGAEDGAALLGELRALPGLEELPAVFLTGRLCAGDQAPVRGSDVRATLRKPFDPLTLASDLRTLAEQSA